MNILVGNIPESMEAEDLRRIFSRFGTVVSAVVAPDTRGGQSRHHGNIYLVPNRAARTAILELDLARVGGRQITVRECTFREERERRANRTPWIGSERRWHRDRREVAAAAVASLP